MTAAGTAALRKHVLCCSPFSTGVKMSITRRGFLGSAAAASLAAGLNAQESKHDKTDASRHSEPMRAVKRPIIVCANNGLPYLNDAFQFLKDGGDTLDAALRV